MSDTRPVCLSRRMGVSVRVWAAFPLSLLEGSLCTSWHPASWSPRARGQVLPSTFKQPRNLLEEKLLSGSKLWWLWMTDASPVVTYPVSGMFLLTTVGHCCACFLLSYRSLYACVCDWGILYILLFFSFMIAFCTKGCSTKNAWRNFEDQINGEAVNEGLQARQSPVTNAQCPPARTKADSECHIWLYIC